MGEWVHLAVDTGPTEAKEDMILEALAVMDTDLLEAKEETVWEVLAAMNSEVLHWELCLLNCVTMGKLDALTMRYVVRWTKIEVVFISAVRNPRILVQMTCGYITKTSADSYKEDRPMT